MAVVIGAQDKSQLVKDYDQKESDVIFNTVGNVFSGAVKGSTAEGLSKSFGKVEREMRSYQESDSSDHVTYSYQLRDVLPPNKIEALSQGSFCGYVADNFDQKIHPKTFCGEVHAGDPPKHNLPVPQIVNMSRKAIEAEVDKNYEKVRVETRISLSQGHKRQSHVWRREEVSFRPWFSSGKGCFAGCSG
mgnify:CR=1 FL=1